MGSYSLRAGLAGALLVVGTLAAGAQPVPDRDHVWVVDQDGRETPIYGCWELKSVTHPLSNATVGDITVFGVGGLENDFRTDGNITGADGRMWTTVGVSFPDMPAFTLLERVETDVEPHRLYILAAINPDGTYHAGIAETAAQFAGEGPDVDLMTYERIRCQ